MDMVYDGAQMALNFTGKGRLAAMFRNESLKQIEVVFFGDDGPELFAAFKWNDRIHRTKEGSKIMACVHGFRALRELRRTR